MILLAALLLGASASYERSVTVSETVELSIPGKDAKEKIQHDLSMELAYTVSTEAKDGELLLTVRITRARLGQTVNGKASSWEMPEDAPPIELAVACDAKGRPKEPPKLRGAFQAAGCDGRLSKIPLLYFSGPLGPTPETTYGLCGLLDDFSRLLESWEEKDGGEAKLKGLSIPQPRSDTQAEILEPEGKAARVEDAKTGLPVSVRSERAFSYTLKAEGAEGKGRIVHKDVLERK